MEEATKKDAEEKEREGCAEVEEKPAQSEIASQEGGAADADEGATKAENASQEEDAAVGCAVQGEKPAQSENASEERGAADAAEGAAKAENASQEEAAVVGCADEVTGARLKFDAVADCAAEAAQEEQKDDAEAKTDIGDAIPDGEDSVEDLSFTEGGEDHPADPTLEIPDLNGKYVMAEIVGPMDEFLKKSSVGYMRRQTYSWGRYGVNRVGEDIRQDGNKIIIHSRIPTGDRSNKFIVNSSEQDYVDTLDGGIATVIATWEPAPDSIPDANGLALVIRGKWRKKKASLAFPEIFRYKVGNDMFVKSFFQDGMIITRRFILS